MVFIERWSLDRFHCIHSTMHVTIAYVCYLTPPPSPPQSSDSLETQQQVFEAGAILSATVLEVRSYGLMLELSAGEKCLLHISDMAHKFVRMLRK